jgi:hypothetical protein
MAIVLDTSVLIDLLRGNLSAHRALQTATDASETVVASVLTKVEVMRGMRRGEEQATRRLLDGFRWIAVDDALAEHAGRLANQYARAYPGIDPIDYVIAATTERFGARLWTHNLKHFPMFPGLTAPY